MLYFIAYEMLFVRPDACVAYVVFIVFIAFGAGTLRSLQERPVFTFTASGSCSSESRCRSGGRNGARLLCRLRGDILLRDVARVGSRLRVGLLRVRWHRRDRVRRLEDLAYSSSA